jgi:hypothetical protein
LLLGATYSLLGIGLTLVFGLMSVVNFAHGEFYTLGAYAAFAALTLASVNFFLAIPLAIAAGAVAGAICEWILLRPLRGQSIDTVMLVMIGVWIAMQNAELLGWGGVAKSVPTLSTQPLVLGPVSGAPLRVLSSWSRGSDPRRALLLSRTKPVNGRPSRIARPPPHGGEHRAHPPSPSRSGPVCAAAGPCWVRVPALSLHGRPGLAQASRWSSRAASATSRAPRRRYRAGRGGAGRGIRLLRPCDAVGFLMIVAVLLRVPPGSRSRRAVG